MFYIRCIRREYPQIGLYFVVFPLNRVDRFYELQAFISFVSPDRVQCGLPGQGSRLLAYTEWSSLSTSMKSASQRRHILQMELPAATHAGAL